MRQGASADALSLTDTRVEDAPRARADQARLRRGRGDPQRPPRRWGARGAAGRLRPPLCALGAWLGSFRLMPHAGTEACEEG